ncbi:MAG TPA: pyridoxamine 5'-phosphate oxidase family protein [Actinocrinis sp.]|nr:pyridoxamine 5'-phosphate oxidase family protein [Actinocrinis sp.]
MTEPPRSLEQRTRDTLARLNDDTDLWVATADGAGIPYLIPLSFHWDGTDLLLATPADSVTARNLVAGGRTRIGVGPTRDLAIIEGELRDTTPAAEIDEETAQTFAERTGFDPRREKGMAYFWIRPVRIQAWREANELTGRTLMRDGRWLHEHAAQDADRTRSEA